jgi:opacity protein-like surface antigen
MKKQLSVVLSGLAVGLLVNAGAIGQTRAGSDVASPAGFYGGVALRQGGNELPSFGLREPPSLWSKFASPTTVDTGSRALLVGGYRWANDLAVEASLATVDRYALRPLDAGERRGVGLSLLGPSDSASRTVNADVYTSWNFRQSFALYGRLGYAQNDAIASYLSSLPPGDARRPRDGVNYGVGLRYDVTPALGLRLEYARFGRFAGETSANGFLPESDQVQLGMQFRF